MSDIPSTSNSTNGDLGTSKADSIRKTSIENSKDKKKDTVNEEDTEDDNEFVVEKILNMKTDKDGNRLFFIKWKGFPESENSWEPEENCVGAADLITEFEEKRKKALANRKRKHEESTNRQLQEKKRTIEIPDDGVSPRGFHRGLQAERIIGATTDNKGELMFLMKWKDCEESDLVKACQANVKCPQIVISFYEDRLDWFDDDVQSLAHTATSASSATRSIATSKT